MSEPMYTTDCRNGHHGRLCGMTPCDCVCHANERPPAEVHRACKDPRCHNLNCLVQSEPDFKCYCSDPRDCASAEPCFTRADLDKALLLLEGPFAKPMSEYSEMERIGIRRVAARVYEDRILNHRLGYGEGYDQALHDVRAAQLEGREAP